MKCLFWCLLLQNRRSSTRFSAIDILMSYSREYSSWDLLLCMTKYLLRLSFIEYNTSLSFLSLNYRTPLRRCLKEKKASPEVLFYRATVLSWRRPLSLSREQIIRSSYVETRFNLKLKIFYKNNLKSSLQQMHFEQFFFFEREYFLALENTF